MKYNGISISYVLSIYYAVIAFMGIFVVLTGLYETVFTLDWNHSFSLVPYLLCFICVSVLILPLTRVRYDNILFSQIPYNKVTRFAINFWIVDMALYLLLKLSQAITASSIGYAEMYDMTNVDGTTVDLFYGDNVLLYKFNNFNVNLSHSLTPFIFCYSFYGLIKKKIAPRKVYLIFSLIVVSQALSAIAYGSRGNLFFTFWTFAFYLALFYDHLPKRLRKTTISLSLIAVSLVLFYSFLISISRVSSESEETPLGSIARYFGEPFPNLGNLYWDNVLQHPYGLRMFPYLFGEAFYEADSVQDGYAFWQKFTGVPVLNFKTIYGDLYIEFGEIAPLFILGALTLIFFLFLGRGKISIWKIGCIYWYFDMVLQGIFGFNKGGESNLVVLTAIILVAISLSIFIKICSLNKKKKKRRRLRLKEIPKEKNAPVLQNKNENFIYSSSISGSV